MSHQTTKIRISEPGELIDAVPYLLGFHPQHSICLLGFCETGTSSRQIELAVRIDLPDDRNAVADVSRLVDALSRSGSRAAIALIYPPEGAGDLSARHRWRWLHEVVVATLASADIELMDVLFVSAHHWWSLCCTDAGCCPEEGHERSVGGSVAAAQAVYAGLVAAPDRAELEACLDGASTAERTSLEPYLAQAENRVVKARTNNGFGRLIRSDAAAVLRAARFGTPRPNVTGAPSPATIGPPKPNAPGEATVVSGAEVPAAGEVPAAPRLTQRQLARHAIALGEISVRDELWLAIDERSLDASDYLLELIRRLPSPYDAPALFLFGWHQWRSGNGTLACIAADRALASDPRCSAARLLLTAVQHGLNPMTTPPLREPTGRMSGPPDERFAG